MQIIIYYLHILIITISVFSAIFLPHWAILLLVTAHLLHTVLFNGCLLTKLSRHLEPTNQNFFQELFTKTFNLHPTKHHTSGITWLIYLFTISINFLAMN